MVCSCVSYRTSAARGVKKSEMLDFLNYLNIINTENNYAEDEVSREEFALFVARMIRLDTEYTRTDEARYFKDVESSGYAANAINGLAALGYIHGYGESDFRPTVNITIEQACCIVLTIMGYDVYAMRYFNEGSRYTQTAKDLDLISFNNPSKNLTVEDVAELFVNAMMTGFQVVSGMSKGNMQYITDDDVTILSKYWGVYWNDGTVTDIYGGSIEGDFFLIDNRIRINDVIYPVSDNINTEDYFGNYVRYFYYASDPDDEGEIFYIMKGSQKAEDRKIDIDLFKSFNADELAYYNDEFTRIYKIRVTQPIVLYNNWPLTSDFADTMKNLNKGYITIKDRDNDGNYDTVMFDDYQNFVVGSVDNVNNIVYNLLSTDDALKINDYDSVRITDENNEKYDISMLKQYTVMSIRKPHNNSIKAVSAVVSSTVFNGVIGSIDTEEKEAYINGVKYDIDKSYLKTFAETVNVSETYYFSTDLFGNIAYVDHNNSNEMRFGYMFKSTHSCVDNGYDEEGLYLKLLTEEGIIRKFRLAEKTKIDGKSFKSYDDMLTYMANCNGIFTYPSYTLNSQILRYSMNSEGEINKIDTLALNNENENIKSSLSARYSDNEEKTAKWFNIERFGLKSVLNTNTIVFYIPNSDKDAPDEGKCTTGKYTMGFVNDNSYYGNAYYVSSHSGFADAALCYYTPDNIEQNRCFVVSKILTCLNSDDEVITKLCGYENGSYKEYEVDREISFSGIDIGDTIRLCYGIDGKIVKSNGGLDVTLVYDASEESCIDWNNVSDKNILYTVGSQEGYRAKLQFSYGYVLKNSSGVISWSNTRGGEMAEEASLSGIPVIMCDTRMSKDGVYIVSPDEIRDYNTAGANCDRIIFVTTPRKVCAIIYRYL